MVRLFNTALLVWVLSLPAMPALAAMSANKPAFSSAPYARPKKVALLPPEVFVYALSAGGVVARMAVRDAAARDNTRMAFQAGLFELVLAPALSPADSDTLVDQKGRLTLQYEAPGIAYYQRGAGFRSHGQKRAVRVLMFHVKHPYPHRLFRKRASHET